MTRQRFIDLLAMSRFANLPTVWSNGLLGALVGWTFFGRFLGPPCPICLTLIGLSLSCLYLGGCFLNDVQDTKFDQKTRPDRAIPAGRWSRKTIHILALGLLTAGLGMSLAVSLPSGLFALGIVICIFAYTKWHKVTAWSFVFMAGARALIYPTVAFSFVSWGKFPLLLEKHAIFFVVLALGLGGYILGISLTAKSETAKTPPTQTQQILPVACLCTPMLLFSLPLIAGGDASAVAPLLLFFIVLVITVRSVHDNHQVGKFVSRTLAAIPLVDCLLVVPSAPHWGYWLACPILALMALGLQKIAPAT